MAANSSRISDSVRAEVGSSMISTRAWVDSALATSTICCWATPSDCTGVRGSRRTPSPSSSAPASATSRRRSSTPPRDGSRPRKMFSAAESCGTRLNSW